jgi:hypothetical protein
LSTTGNLVTSCRCGHADSSDAGTLAPAVPATVSYELRWNGPVTREISVRDTDYGFRGLFKENTVSLTWSASRAGFKFVSDAANTSTVLFAELGRESNGVFF